MGIIQKINMDNNNNKIILVELSMQELNDTDGGTPVATAAAMWAAWYGMWYVAGETYYNLTH
jgi:hypothetical protein